MSSTLEKLHLGLQAARAMLPDDGLTLTQASILRAIRDSKEPPSQTDIVTATGIDRSTLADVMRRLIATKLATRKRDKNDARAYVVEITAEGARQLKAFESAEKKVEKDVKNTLGKLGISIKA
jgi:DNA-binding MarR family transcriptional regulator